METSLTKDCYSFLATPYVLTRDYSSLRGLARCRSRDQIVILVNNQLVGLCSKPSIHISSIPFAEISSALWTSSSTSQFAKRYLPFVKPASLLVNHTLKSAGSETPLHQPDSLKTHKGELNVIKPWQPRLPIHLRLHHSRLQVHHPQLRILHL